MKVICDYNEKRDIAQVDQVGYVDLADCYLEGAVPASADVDISNYNEIDDPNSIVGKPSDVFEALEAAHGLKSAINSSENTEE